MIDQETLRKLREMKLGGQPADHPANPWDSRSDPAAARLEPLHHRRGAPGSKGDLRPQDFLDVALAAVGDAAAAFFCHLRTWPGPPWSAGLRFRVVAAGSRPGPTT